MYGILLGSPREQCQSFIAALSDPVWQCQRVDKYLTARRVVLPGGDWYTPSPKRGLERLRV